MNYLKHLVFIGFLFFSCSTEQNNNPTAEPTAKETPKKAENNGSAIDDIDAPSFLISTKEDENGLPQSTVQINYNGRPIEAAKALNTEKITRGDYTKYSIPETAVDACGGWWAGQGSYFYLVRNEQYSFWEVMRADIEEEGSTNYEYKNIMSLTYKKQAPKE